MAKDNSSNLKKAGNGLRGAVRWAFTVAALAVSFSAFATHPAFANGAANAPQVLVRSDNGGSLYSYASSVSRMNQNGTRVAIQGNCVSACTLYLALPSSQVCLHPGASFSFHSAYGASATANNIGTDYMMRKYPAWVRSWIAANGGLTNQMKHMSYSYASKFIAPCAPAGVPSQVRGTTIESISTRSYIAPVAAQQRSPSLNTQSALYRDSRASR